MRKFIRRAAGRLNQVQSGGDDAMEQADENAAPAVVTIPGATIAYANSSPRGARYQPVCLSTKLSFVHKHCRCVGYDCDCHRLVAIDDQSKWFM